MGQSIFNFSCPFSMQPGKFVFPAHTTKTNKSGVGFRCFNCTSFGDTCLARGLWTVETHITDIRNYLLFVKNVSKFSLSVFFVLVSSASCCYCLIDVFVCNLLNNPIYSWFFLVINYFFKTFYIFILLRVILNLT